jgi:hypothetical protein
VLFDLPCRNLSVNWLYMEESTKDASMIHTEKQKL